ncbi:MAG: MFS transporter [Candidatus Gastranaerophilales bacterium]|nr:MFS transporter [Candidatus Gastranaerophilales bacterium]
MNTKPTDKKALGWLSGAHLINDTYSGFLNPIMPFIAAKIGITVAIATAIMGIAQICASMFQPIFGFWADNSLKRVFIFWGLIFGSLFIPLATNAPNAPILTLCVILGNLGGSFFHPQALGFIAKFSHRNFVSNMGIFISAGTVGFSFGPIISALVAENFGLEKIPYLALIGVTFALFMFACVPKISGKGEAPEYKYFKESFKEILTNRNMNILTVIAMMKALITNSCMILLPFLWKDLGYSPTYIGISLFLFMLTGGLGSLVSGRAEAKLGAKLIFYISMIATLPIMILFILTYKHYPLVSIVIFVIMAFTTMLAQPVMIVMAQRILPDYRSIVSGFINGFAWGIVAIFLIIIGFCAQEFGIPKVLLVVSIIPAIASYLVKYLPDHVDVTINKG